MKTRPFRDAETWADWNRQLTGPSRTREEGAIWGSDRADRGRSLSLLAGESGLPPAQSYLELDLRHDHNARTLWCYMRPLARPSFTRSLLRELIALRRALRAAVGESALMAAVGGSQELARYFVGGSRLAGIYNLGGDLPYFVQSIRTQDQIGLQRYAYDCLEVNYHMWAGFELPIITIALVQGDAMGGGFEAALCFNVIVAERSARFGFPEILLNLFPGMGAYSFISRKLSAKHAERMMFSGQIYTAEQLYELGLVDVLAADGQGEAAVRDYVTRNGKHHAVLCSVREVRDRIQPVALDELKDVANLWVDHALQLDESDLRRMERLSTAQDRRMAQSEYG